LLQDFVYLFPKRKANIGKLNRHRNNFEERKSLFKMQLIHPIFPKENKCPGRLQ